MKLLERYSTELDNKLDKLAPADPASYAEWLFSLAQGVGDNLSDIEHSETVTIAQILATIPAGSAPEGDRVKALLVLHDSALHEGDTDLIE